MLGDGCGFGTSIAGFLFSSMSAEEEILELNDARSTMSLAADCEHTDTFDAQLLRHQSFLRLLACAEIVPSLRKRIEPSDIVQQTLLEAHDRRDQFRGQTDAEMAQWLRQILQHNIVDSLRALQTQKRDIAREQRQTELNKTSLRLDNLLDSYSTPSQHAIRSEQLLRLSESIFQLPQDQREAIIQHHLRGKKLAQISTEWHRSEASIAGLLQRGLRKLRTLMADS